MEVKFDGIVDALKLPSYILGALAIASGLLLFLPDNIIRALYMMGFREKYGFTIGIVFVVSLSILLVLLAKQIYKAVTSKGEDQKLIARQVKYLSQLSDNKASLITEFLRQPTRTLLLPLNNGVIIEFQHFFIISPAGSTHLVSMPDPEINFFLQPWVEDRIKENEELRAKYHI